MKRSLPCEVSSSSPPVKTGKSKTPSPTKAKVNETVIRLRPILKFKESDELPSKVVAVQVFNGYYQKEMFQGMQGGGLIAKLLFRADEEDRQMKVREVYGPGIKEEATRVKQILFY